MKLALQGPPNLTIDKIDSSSSLVAYFLREAIMELNDDTLYYSGEPPEEPVDWVLNLNPVARNWIIREPEKYRVKGKIALFNTIPGYHPWAQVMFTIGPSIAHNVDMPEEWGEHWVKGSGKIVWLYPFAPKDYVRDETIRGKVVIDNIRNREDDHLNDRHRIYRQLGRLIDEYPLDVWQEWCDSSTPDWIKPICTEEYVDHSWDPPRTIMPWAKYRRHVNEAMIWLPTLSESYGYDKYHAVAGKGQVLMRRSYTPEAYRTEFQFQTYRHPAGVRDAVDRAFYRWDENQELLQELADKVWTYRKLAGEMLDYMEAHM